MGTEERRRWQEAIEVKKEIKTYGELFEKANTALKTFPELAEALEHLDYGLCNNSLCDKNLKYDDRFQIIVSVNQGGSEGVYADVAFKTTEATIDFATFKTRDEPYCDGIAPFIRMGMIAAAFEGVAEQLLYRNLYLKEKKGE